MKNQPRFRFYWCLRLFGKLKYGVRPWCGGGVQTGNLVRISSFNRFVVSIQPVFCAKSNRGTGCESQVSTFVSGKRHKKLFESVTSIP